jgi:hypothetical protein
MGANFISLRNLIFSMNAFALPHLREHRFPLIYAFARSGLAAFEIHAQTLNPKP